MLPKTLSVAEARQRFAEVLGKVAYASEEFIITRKGDSSLFPAPSAGIGALFGHNLVFVSRNVRHFEISRICFEKLGEQAKQRV
jgi:hypothetical protein